MKFSTPARGLRQQAETLLREQLRSFLFSKASMDQILSEGTAGQLDFLLRIMTDEVERRQASRRNRLVRQAGFPTPKTLGDYDFSRITFPALLPKDRLLSLDFIVEKRSLVFYGVCGSGKTHLAMALGYKACMQGLKVRFMTVSHLVFRLEGARAEGRLERLLADLKALDLLVLDEWGYVPIDRQGAQLLFQVIADSYEHKSLIVTTNLPFSEWGKLVTDEQLAAAMIDRIVHYGHLIETGNRDWRLDHSLMRDCVGNA